MNVSGKINVFAKIRGKYKFFEGAINSKNKDGKFDKCSIEVKFVGEKFPKEKVETLKENVCYVIDVKEGFLSVDTWEDKTLGKTRRKIILCIMDGSCISNTPVDTKKLSKESKSNLNKKDKEEDLPF